MSNSRLTQIGVSGRAYETPADVDLTTANWGWTAYPVTVAYETPAVSRLSQMGVSAAAYPTEQADVIGIATANWGWQSFAVTVDYADPLDVDIQLANWGWTPQNVNICSQYDRGWFGSFNENVWPTCVFNDHVFGPRVHLNPDTRQQSWGWAPYDVTVTFTDPVDVDVGFGNWGWFGYPVAVSVGYEIQLTIMPWGWQSFPVTVESPQEIDISTADWGWRPHPVTVSTGLDIGVSIATWGWQSFPATVDAPVYDIRLRKADWGWQSFPVEVRQTSLLPGDIDAIAEAVWAKMQAEGAVQHWLETWQRQGCDSAHPQTIRHPDNGGDVEVGGMTIEQIETPEGDVVQTRQ